MVHNPRRVLSDSEPLDEAEPERVAEEPVPMPPPDSGPSTVDEELPEQVRHLYPT